MGRPPREVVVPDPVPFFRHGLRPEDAGRVAAVLDSAFLTSGPVGRGVEQQLAELLDVRHALLTNSWTNGAVATLLALGVGPGDDVLVPAMTFVATANVVELVGARPVFVDVSPTTLLLEPAAAAAARTDTTRAVIPVHLYGQMCDLPGLRSALGDDVAIVEDAAHCLEGSRAGRRPGADADAAIFSFYATKNVTCGEGGAVVTNRDDLAEAVAVTRLHGMSAAAADRFAGGSYRHWDMVRLGTKANLPDLLAALLPPQLEAVEDRRRERERLALRYDEAFAGSGLRRPSRVDDVVHTHHLYPVGVDPRHRDEALSLLGQAGVGATVNYTAPPLTTHHAARWGTDAAGFPVAAEWGRATLSLPLYPDLPPDEQTRVIEVVRDSVIPRCVGVADGAARTTGMEEQRP